MNHNYSPIKPPCQGCPNRKVGCHNPGQCEKFDEYMKLKDEEEAQRKIRFNFFMSH